MLKRNIPNLLTAVRIVCAAALLPLHCGSGAFVIIYCLAGLSDIADGAAARGMGLQSKFGAVFDSAADVVFIVVCTLKILPILHLEPWAIIGIIIAAVIRLSAYAIGFFKYGKFSAVHTYANKITGFLLFLFPIAYVLNISAAVPIVMTAALLSAAEELIITLTASDLDRNRRGLF